ncbi:MAG: YkvA family protein [Armatimonadota bacterium]
MPDETPLPNIVNRLSQTLRRQVLPVLGRVPSYGRLIYALATEAGLPAADKRALFLALGYQFSPVDLLPGFIPVIGQLDDLLVMFWGIRTTLEKLPPERGDEILAGVTLTREQIAADTEVVRVALRELVTRPAVAAGKGLWSAMKSTVIAGTYVGYLAYYLVKRKKKT